MSAVIKIVGAVAGHPTPFDGEFLVEYDPNTRGVDPDGKLMVAHVLTTPVAELAKKYPTAVEAWEDWKRVSTRWPDREDGKPNRPLTAFTVEVKNVA